MIRALWKLALTPAGKAVGAFLAISAISGALYAKGNLDGRAAVHARLKNDRIKILHDGKVIDHEALVADDDGLCALLGGCELPNP